VARLPAVQVLSLARIEPILRPVAASTVPTRFADAAATSEARRPSLRGNRPVRSFVAIAAEKPDNRARRNRYRQQRPARADTKSIFGGNRGEASGRITPCAAAWQAADDARENIGHRPPRIRWLRRADGTGAGDDLRGSGRPRSPQYENYIGRTGLAPSRLFLPPRRDRQRRHLRTAPPAPVRPM
jgi:hypothetical protein